MKKFFKLFICALTFLVGCGVALANPAINVVHALTTFSGTTVTNAKGTFQFKSVKMPTKVDAEADTDKTGFKIPIPQVTSNDGGTKVTINVREGKNTYKYEVGEENEDNKYFEKDGNGETDVIFKYNASTTYEVYYTAVKDGKTYASAIYEVEVTGVSYTFDAELSDILPNIASVGDYFLLPAINVKNSKDTIVGEAITPTVIKNNAALVKSTNGTGELREADGKLYLHPSQLGTYTIRYTDAAHNLTRDYNIDVVEKSQFDSSKVQLEAKTLTLSTVELGKEETKFPKPEVSDSYNNIDKVPVSYQITIIDNSTNAEVKKLGLNEYSYMFEKEGSYTVKYEITNFYLNNTKTITTQISEEVLVRDQTAPVVKFASNYEVPTAEADKENWEDDVKVLGDWAIPTKIGYNVIHLPAVYATDYGTKYENLTFQRVIVLNNHKEYDIDNPADNAAITEADGYNAETYKKDVTKAIDFKFPRENDETDEQYIARVKGTYTVEYRATEVVGENKTQRTGTLSRTLQVLGVDAESGTTDTHLKITLPALSDEMKSDEVKTVTVTKPTDDSDKAIETHYFYYYGKKETIDNKFNTYKTEDSENEFASDFGKFLTEFNNDNGNDNDLVELVCEDNKLTIELKDYASQQKFTLVAVAINDQGQFVYDAKEIKIKNATTDNAAPETKSVTGEFKSCDSDQQYVLGTDTKIELPSVTFKDAGDSELTVTVQYYVDSPENGYNDVNGGCVVYTTQSEGSEHETTISGCTIEPHQAGTYYVVYHVVDDANNAHDFVTCFSVEKETIYSIHVDYEKELDIYDSTDIVAYVVDQDGNRVDDAEVKVQFTGRMPKREGSTYTFNTADTYTFVCTSTYNEKQLTSGEMTIKVNDVAYVWDNESSIDVPKTSPLSPANDYEKLTEQPADWSSNYTSYYKYEGSSYTQVTNGDSAPDFAQGTYYKKTEKVYVTLSVPTATQNGKRRRAEVKVTDPNGDGVTLEDVIVDGVSTGNVRFLAEKEGKYTVTFSVGSDSNGKTKTFNVQVGDSNPPIIRFSNKATLQKDITYNNKDITYKLTYAYDSSKSNGEQNVYNVTIRASEGDKEIYSYTVEMALYDIDRNGNKVALSWSNAIKNSSIKLNGKTSESSSEYIWTISSVDKYELSIVATDTHGVDSKAELIKFEVVNKADNSKKNDNKVGIILIVISIIVLASVIAFFAFSGKSAANKNKKPKANDEKKEN